MLDNEKTIQIDRFVAESKKLLGKEVQERAVWNTCVSEDAIRHFALGIGDDNPLYIDPAYGQNGPYGRQVAPPAFLTSVLYPILHGAPMPVPLWFLVGEVAFEWFLPILADDRLRATSKLVDLYDTQDSAEERRIFIISEICYLNQHDLLVGKCTGTTVCVPKNADRLLIERSVYKYSEKEIDKIGAVLRDESRRGNQRFHDNEIMVGKEMPEFVRGPLTIGDLICWQTAIGPAYQAGAPGYRRLVELPHVTGKHPVTGWPVEASQQHEDFLLTAQRGMPAPFDQGVMRFACLTPMITNWIGDTGFLNSLSVKIVAPTLYGDTTWYHGTIAERSDYPESVFLKLKIIGKNQLGETTTEAEAGVTLPRKDSLAFHHHGRPANNEIAKETVFKEGWVKDVFENQALKRSKATALVFGETRLTYAEVNGQADRLADYLISIGVKVNDPVAICMQRSHQFVIAVLGVLKAGAAYLPLDSGYPQMRLKEIMDDCRAQVLIVDAMADRSFQAYTGQKISFDAFEQDTAKEDHHSPKTEKDDFAYIMYTSGSMGNVKGVAVTQRSLFSYLAGLKQTFDIHDRDIHVHTASFAFSASTRQLFLPLSVGATLVIADDEQRWDPIALAELIQREGVTHWDCVPSFFNLCCEALESLNSTKKRALLDNKLRRIMITGELLTWKAPLAWNRTLGHRAEIVNLYSQTETSGTVCVYHIPRDFNVISESVPIGRPLANTSIYLLDENQRPVSYGQTGEICVAGPRIVNGYLNQPDLTAEQFVPHPFRDDAKALMFKTGDLGCYLPDGNIVIKGRLDRRVKIRGFRIELEEIERALGAHSSIERAVVTVSEKDDQEPLLNAYYVAGGESSPSQKELRSHLQGLLPDYMLPSHYIGLPKIPLGPNGKVDYSALPMPDPTHSELETTFVSPMTHIEKTLVDIWSEILGINRLGRHDNFFELGGHSLSAARMMTRLRNVFQIDLPFGVILEAPTVAALSDLIAQRYTEPISLVDKVKIICELENMSDEEAENLLAKEMAAMDVQSIETNALKDKEAYN